MIFNQYLAYYIQYSFCVIVVGLSILLLMACEIIQVRKHICSFLYPTNFAYSRYSIITDLIKQNYSF